MKSRIDFVTNSSSTSYCIFGVESDVLIDNPTDWDMAAEKVKDVSKRGLLLKFVGEDNYQYGVIGLDISEMKGNETLNHFKQRVADKIKAAFPDAMIYPESISILPNEYNHNL